MTRRRRQRRRGSNPAEASPSRSRVERRSRSRCRRTRRSGGRDTAVLGQTATTSAKPAASPTSRDLAQTAPDSRPASRKGDKTEMAARSPPVLFADIEPHRVLRAAGRHGAAIRTACSEHRRRRSWRSSRGGGGCARARRRGRPPPTRGVSPARARRRSGRPATPALQRRGITATTGVTRGAPAPPVAGSTPQVPPAWTRSWPVRSRPGSSAPRRAAGVSPPASGCGRSTRRPLGSPRPAPDRSGRATSRGTRTATPRSGSLATRPKAATAEGGIIRPGL